MNRLLLSFLLVTFATGSISTTVSASDSIVIHVKHAEADVPVKLGIPFPKDALFSPDHVRVLNENGEEILSQITEVSSWQPAGSGLKWLWVFFFTDESKEYSVQYGEDVNRTVQPEKSIVFKNNQRERGYAEINTGPMLLRIEKGGSGFIDTVQFRSDESEFSDENTVASGIPGRGSFLDYINEEGPDHSKAVLHQHFIEKGSGPLHAIVRVEGEYEYDDPEHENSPFVTYIHAYAGKSYLKVYHTITYTGKPDKSEPLNGKQHADIATQTELIIDESERSRDEGLTQPHDMISSAGFGLEYHLDGEKTVRTELLTGEWWETGDSDFYEAPAREQKQFSVLQSGPDHELNSDESQRIDGFSATISVDNEIIREGQKAEGWISISDDQFGVSVGIRNMVEEYPNELAVDLESGRVFAYTWSPNGDPMSFEREDTDPDGGMVGNFARGLTKTTEAIFYFHEGSKTLQEIKQTMDFVLNPPVAHADPSWYGKSGVYGTFVDSNNNFPFLERSMQYKFEWMLFNQNWEPWYGMFNYGDVKNYYFRDDWYQWSNNEPAQDFIWWTQFIRTGDPAMYKMAQAASRHTMDVDNTHWPRPREYRGDTNSSLDWFLSEQQEEGSPYLGMGRRHAGQQWISMLSAHVWLTGWVSSYYLDGYHRGLDVARLTGDYYIRRVFGEHGLTGRRLYLSVWNLTELYDATKEQKYLDELNERVDLVLELQKHQGGRMVIDRYGYSQNYLSHGLIKYLQMFDRPDIKRAYLTHARSIEKVPPIDHDFESFLSSIHPLITAYDLSGESKFLKEACMRASHLLVDPMSGSFNDFDTQKELAEEMEQVSRLPEGGGSFFSRRPIWSFSGGMRIFGWTHAYSVPYLIERLENVEELSGYQCVE